MDSVYSLTLLVLLVSIASGQPPPGRDSSHPYVPPPPQPRVEGRACSKLEDCGNSGCCLKGRCSLTGASMDPCYRNIPENGRLRPSGIWTKTDLCPCDYTYICLPIPLGMGDVDPKFGQKGTCFPILR